jgi:L-alanine-DL-glutamate epimerase-like enolase superfamily enzyme
MMDAHGALPADRAVRLGESARELELTWFEEPVLADDDLPGLAEVRRRVPMPVATGESEPRASPFGTSSSSAPPTSCSRTWPWSAG